MAANKFKADEKPKKTKKLPIENFYAHYAKYSFLYDTIDNEPDSPAYGKKVIMLDNHNNPLYHRGSGKVKVQQTQEFFRTESDKMSLGFLSVATFDPNTEDKQELVRGERLREISKREDIFMYDEDTHKKHTNYAAWKEAKKGKEQAEYIKTLEQRLADAEGK